MKNRDEIRVVSKKYGILTVSELLEKLRCEEMNPCLCGCGKLVSRTFAKGHHLRVYPNKNPMKNFEIVKRRSEHWNPAVNLPKNNNGVNNPFYGKHHSEETKRLMSIQKTGKNHPFYGKKRPEHSLKMIGEKNPAKHPEARKKISLRWYLRFTSGLLTMKEENNPNWKGGISFEPYGLEFNYELKIKILERDNYSCRQCGKLQMDEIDEIGCSLDIHHIDYNKKNNDKNNLITLCRSCNAKANSDREFYTLYYKYLLQTGELT